MAFGVVGPGAGAHGIDEKINLPFAKNLLCSISYLISSVGKQYS